MYPVRPEIFAAKTVGNDDPATVCQKIKTLHQPPIQRNVLKALGKKADIERPINSSVFELGFMYPGFWCVLTTALCQERAWHDNLDLMAKGNKLARCFTGPTADIKDSARVRWQSF